MSKIFVFVAGLAAAAFLAGCTTPLPPGAEPGPDHTMAYDVLIEASAPGAKIEVNGEMIGDAPLHIKIFGDPDGTFHDFGSDYYQIRALPVSTNQFEQVRLFQTGHMLGPQDKIPQRVYFDMNKQPPVYVPVPVYSYPRPYYGPDFYFEFGGPRYYRGYRHYYGGPRHYVPVPVPPHPFHHHH